MDAYEATRIVLSRIQTLDPENASKIMGLLLIQDHGEKEMIRLAFGPEALLHSVVLKARKDLGLLPASTPTTPSSPSPSPFLLSRQNSSSRLPSPSSWAPSPVFSRRNGTVDEFQSADDLISPNSSSPSPFHGADLVDEFHLQDQFSFLNDPLQIGGQKSNGEVFYPENGESALFNYAGMNWNHHRRSLSAAENSCLSPDAGADLGWRPCLYFARGFCKNGSSCRFLHGLPDDAMEQQFQELLLRAKSPRLMAAAASFPYSHSPPSPSSGKCVNFLQQQQSESQRVAAAVAALSLGGEEQHKFGRSRLERASDYAGAVNPGSRQIYLTFPADSTFREEDVANYFSIYGPVQDVRIPYQQKRMFGFVTFVYPETVKLILAKGNPHFVCDARVLVKPYKEKGKVPDKYRKQQQQQIAERAGVFSGCTTPTGLDSKDSYDLQLLGASMLYNNAQEALLRKKLEEQQQAVELQHAIELQRRRIMGMQLLDLKARNLSSPNVPVSSPLPSPGPINPYSSSSISTPNATTPEGGSSASSEELPQPPPDAPAVAADEKIKSYAFRPQSTVHAADKENPSLGGIQESDEHNLPDSPFASPTKGSFAGNAFSGSPETPSEIAPISRTPNNNNGHLITSTLDVASFNSCFFPMPRFSSGHGAVGM